MACLWSRKRASSAHLCSRCNSINSWSSVHSVPTPRPITGFVLWPNSKPLAVTWEVLFVPPRVRIAARWPGPSRWVQGGLSWPEWSFLNRLLRAISGAKLPEAEVTAAAAAEDAGIFSARVEDPLNSQETFREHSLPEKGPLGSQLPTLGSWEMLVHSHPRG